MSNSIDNNFEIDNSISNLSFLWCAIFKDGSKIEQFENREERRFQEVKEKINELAYFNLKNNNGKLFSVDLLNGLIGYNDLVLPYRETKEKKENIRLIYFRRHKVEIGQQDLKEKSHTITYHLGYQYLDKLGNNRQIVLQIDNKGNWILGE